MPKDDTITLIGGAINLTVRPLHTAAFLSAQAAARIRMQRIADAQEDLNALGAFTDGQELIGLAEADKEGVYHYLLLEELAQRCITAWDVTLEGSDDIAPLNTETRQALISDPIVAQEFYEKLTAWMTALTLKKNASRRGVSGTLGAGRNTAATV